MERPQTLPAWRSVLVVVAHPDDESFGLGAVIDTLVSHGASVTVLCLTHGEASTLHGSTADLATLREKTRAVYQSTPKESSAFQTKPAVEPNSTPGR